MKTINPTFRCFHLGMAWYKWMYVKPLLKQKYPTCCSLKKWHGAIGDSVNDFAPHEQKQLFVWGVSARNQVNELRKTGQFQHIISVEDGFIRSLGLGSALSRPLSLVLDSRGIYYDPTRESDLEHLLEYRDFSESELLRAESLVNKIIALRLSKYNHQMESSEIGIVPKNGQKVILIPGQVDDDMSIKYGAYGMTNLKLLQMVRAANPQAYIIYKPHPDVLENNRKGNMEDAIPLQFADIVIRDIGIDSVLNFVSEVHTMTSLVGFEALIRGKAVYTYGLPFYAGWGLTTDLMSCERRSRQRNLNELAAAALVEYPSYFDPETYELTTPEKLVEFIAAEKDKLQRHFAKRTLMAAQAKVLPRIRNLLKSLRNLFVK